MTIIEKILAAHAGKEKAFPGDMLDVKVDVRLARDFGGANVVKILDENGLSVEDSSKTYFTFDCNPTGSDQEFTANQHKCRVYARENYIGLYDIDSGIGTHLAIDEGLAVPGNTVVSTDSHTNILGAIGAFGQGLGERDIAAAWSRGSVWYKVPESVKITFTGERPEGISAKDIILNMLHEFGADSLKGYSVELYGDEIEKMTLSERVTISSMATELGAVSIIIPPSEWVVRYCKIRSGKKFKPVYADEDAVYAKEFKMNMEEFFPAVALPGKPDNVVPVKKVKGKKIDSVIIGSCSNGRIWDMRKAANVLRRKRIAPGVILKIVPATDEIWTQCLKEGLLDIFKEAGAMVSNAGCASCVEGQVGQNGPGEVTISTGNKNFAGIQGNGEIYLTSPATAAASAISGYITTVDDIAEIPVAFEVSGKTKKKKKATTENSGTKPTIIEGKIWLVGEDNIDTEMIFNRKHISKTELSEIGKHTFSHLKGWEDYAQKTEPGDIVIAGKNFGIGCSRQQAVDCFKALDNQAIIARSFAPVYERDAINAGFPLLTYKELNKLELENRDTIRIDLKSGLVTNLKNNKTLQLDGFSDVQMKIYQKGDLLSI